MIVFNALFEVIVLSVKEGMIPYLVLKENGNVLKIVEAPRFISEEEMHEWFERNARLVLENLRIIQREYPIANRWIDLLRILPLKLEFVAIECKNKPKSIPDALEDIKFYVDLWRARIRFDIQGYVIFPVLNKFQRVICEYAILHMILQRLEPTLSASLYAEERNGDAIAVYTAHFPYRWLLSNYEVVRIEVVRDLNSRESYLNVYPPYSKVFEYLIQHKWDDAEYFDNMFEKGLPSKRVDGSKAIDLLKEQDKYSLAIRLFSYQFTPKTNFKAVVDGIVRGIVAFANFVRKARRNSL